MGSLLRRSLIWTLAIAMVVAGLPLAHAQDCATLSPGHPVHEAAHAMHHDMATHHDALAHDVSVASHKAPHRHDGSPASNPCKCLNCSSLCAAFVAPVSHLLKIERRVDAIVYVVSAPVQRDTSVFIDPGIPIAA